MPAGRHALAAWPRLSARLMSGKLLLVCLDYDGTLTPIRRRPQDARISPRVQAALARLARCPGVRVAVVSGRSLNDVRGLVGLRGLTYAGNHGCEIAGPGGRFVHPGGRRCRPVMRRLARALRGVLRGVAGSEVENKGLSLSVHWRRVQRGDRRAFHRLVARALRPWAVRGRVRVMQGKRVVEVRPPGAWGKGDAVRRLIARLGGRRRALACYVGDDRTDEDAFRAVNRLGGVSVVVGRPSAATAARWRLDHAGQVGVLLSRLAAAMRAHR
jgi:trehalose-phosphatase